MKAHVIPGTSRKSLSQMRRWMKLICIVLHNDYGFGVDRLGGVLDGTSKLSDEEKRASCWKKYYIQQAQEQEGHDD